MAMRLLVGILTYNRLSKLRHLVDNPCFWEGIDHLFVYSQASEDGTDEWLAEYQAQHPDRAMTVWSSWQNLMAIGGRQRLLDKIINWGLTDEDILIMLDDDMMPISPGWAKRLAQPLIEDETVGAAGVQGFQVTWGPGLFLFDEVGETDIVNGGWTAYRGKVFLEGVEFDQRYMPFWHCDSDLAMQIRERGYRVIKVGNVGLAHAPHHHKVDDLWREKRRLFIDKWRGKGLTRVEKEQPSSLRLVDLRSDVVSLYAPDYDPYSGYGRMALELVHWISGTGVHVNPLGVPSEKIQYSTQSEAVRELLSKPIMPALGGIKLGYPSLYEEYAALGSEGPSMAVTMFESTRFPEGWATSLNQCQAVVVPSRWLEKAMRQNGVMRPQIHVIPLGISEVYVPPASGQRKVRVPPTPENPYRFLTIGDRGRRKGWDVALKAFRHVFGDREDVQLVIKARKGSFPYDIQHNNVRVIRDDLDERRMRDLYLYCDCMVFPSRGEGFGLPPREFAATGGPAICTEWWADDVQQWGYRVEYSMVRAWEQHEKHEGLGKWAEPDQAHLEKQMLHVFEQDPAIIAYMGGRSAVRIRKQYSWKRFAEAVWAIWQDMTSEKTISAKRAARRRRRAVGNVGD
jgi:glycosyltransferase involved in cell wall biosynthesis